MSRGDFERKQNILSDCIQGVSLNCIVVSINTSFQFMYCHWRLQHLSVHVIQNVSFKLFVWEFQTDGQTGVYRFCYGNFSAAKRPVSSNHLFTVVIPGRSRGFVTFIQELEEFHRELKSRYTCTRVYLLIRQRRSPEMFR